jgi:hypothetical protein
MWCVTLCRQRVAKEDFEKWAQAETAKYERNKINSKRIEQLVEQVENAQQEIISHKQELTSLTERKHLCNVLDTHKFIYREEIIDCIG